MAGSQVVVLGGGFGGLETAFSLREHTGRRAEITLVSRRGRFVMRPATLQVAFGAPLDSAHLNIGPAAARRNIRFVHGTVAGIDTGAGFVETEEGRRLSYDRLVVATGARPDWERVEGLRDRALSIWEVDDLLQLRRELTVIAERASEGRQATILFALPPGNSCPSPLYEIALATDAWLRRRRVREAVELNFSTYERSYLCALDATLDARVNATFHRQGIHGNRLYALERVAPDRAYYRNGAAIEYDVIVTFPPQRPAVRLAELEADAAGWLLADPETREAPGHPEVQVVGDAGATDLRTAYRALAQADAAAAGLGRWLRGSEFRPVVAVAPQDDFWSESRAWRTGRQLVGAYLPRRFRRGLPFESELGVRALSKLVV